jgi:hypothetical protein
MQEKSMLLATIALSFAAVPVILSTENTKRVT